MKGVELAGALLSSINGLEYSPNGRRSKPKRARMGQGAEQL